MSPRPLLSTGKPAVVQTLQALAPEAVGTQPGVRSLTCCANAGYEPADPEAGLALPPTGFNARSTAGMPR